MDLEVEMFRGCGSAEVGLRVAGVGRKVWRAQGEDVRGAEQESRDPVFTNPAWPELQWHPQPGLLTAATPSCWDCRRMIGGSPGGVGETRSRTGPATGRWSQLRGPLAPWLGRGTSACGSQSNRSRWCDVRRGWGRRNKSFSYHEWKYLYVSLWVSFRTTASRKV